MVIDALESLCKDNFKSGLSSYKSTTCFFKSMGISLSFAAIDLNLPFQRFGARQPAASASVSVQNHLSLFSVLIFVRLYERDQGV